MRILVGVTGASGSVYAERLIQSLLGRVDRIYLIATDTGKKVALHELKSHDRGFSLVRALADRLLPAEKDCVRVFRNDDLFAPVASGSAAPDAMVVAPCSMGTMARICHGMSGNLIERAADVCVKQSRRLVICPREAPLSVIHLRNMLTLAEMGARIVPAMPGFYNKPSTMDELVDFVVGKLLEELGLSHDLYPVWNAPSR